MSGTDGLDDRTSPCRHAAEPRGQPRAALHTSRMPRIPLVDKEGQLTGFDRERAINGWSNKLNHLYLNMRISVSQSVANLGLNSRVRQLGSS